ncbi:12535_t:CDS:2 [Acaulospora colombiana]|uniref:12535_t:CDS:1 n=1 Tax=Acaulospora colombiana TaxID=27376 RepID=A0ACA9NHA6_9GLOM|nr:12535_t:CDS:2 [Acaulospora colombiana]
MFGISTILSSLLLLSTLASASPAPAPAGVVADVVDIAERAVTCKKKSYGPFRLYAAPAGSSGEDWVLLKLIDLYTPRPTNDTIQALSICTADDCGHLPSYWTLDDQVLHAVFAPEREGWSTAGLRVQVDSQVRFVTSDNASVVRQQAKQYLVSLDDWPLPAAKMTFTIAPTSPLLARPLVQISTTSPCSPLRAVIWRGTAPRSISSCSRLVSSPSPSPRKQSSEAM